MEFPKTLFRYFPESPRREQPPSPRRFSDERLHSEKEGNSNASMVGLNLNSRTRPYYFRRCKRVRPTHIESLPSELLFDILVRLPADHLYDRARLVCRRWYHIVHSYDFINTQIQRSTYGLALSSHSACGGPYPILITATQGGRIEPSEFSYSRRNSLLSSCNGMGMVFYSYSILPYIINPATKQSFSLPPFPYPIYFATRFGISFAPRSMKYKLILPYMKNSQYCLAILTFGVDNSWRDVVLDRTHVLTGYQHLDFRPLVTEGFLHWAFRYCTVVLTMDIETEMLSVSEIPFPKEYGKETFGYYLSTGRFLSLLVGNGDFSWEIWGMKSETGKWRKVLPDIKLVAQKHRLQQLASAGEAQFLEPIGWVKYPEVLALSFLGESCTCIFYNLDTHEINSIELPHPCAWYHGIVHKNSLTWLR